MTRRHWYWWRCFVPGCREQGRKPDGLEAFEAFQRHYRKEHMGGDGKA